MGVRGYKKRRRLDGREQKKEELENEEMSSSG